VAGPSARRRPLAWRPIWPPAGRREPEVAAEADELGRELALEFRELGDLAVLHELAQPGLDPRADPAQLAPIAAPPNDPQRSGPGRRVVLVDRIRDRTLLLIEVKIHARLSDLRADCAMSSTRSSSTRTSSPRATPVGLLRATRLRGHVVTLLRGVVDRAVADLLVHLLLKSSCVLAVLLSLCRTV
jgi:hypothetical protein